MKTNGKLYHGSNIRVIAPSRSLSLISKSAIRIAEQSLLELGLNVSYGENVHEILYNSTGSIQGRVSDLHAAFLDPSVEGILTVIGGLNANSILNEIDFDLIQDNPKPLCGYSDITTLLNAIYSRTGITTYHGPHFSTFGIKKGNQYTIEYFEKCLFNETPFEVLPSDIRSSDQRYLNQEDRLFTPNKGFISLRGGEAEGILIGGNLNTLNILQGTNYLPNSDGIILFIEEVGQNSELAWFDRNLESITEVLGEKIVGLLIGRFEDENIDLKLLRTIISSKKKMSGIPIIYNIDFGHTNPMCTLPIGGYAKIISDTSGCKITILQH